MEITYSYEGTQEHLMNQDLTTKQQHLQYIFSNFYELNFVSFQIVAFHTRTLFVPVNLVPVPYPYPYPTRTRVPDPRVAVL